MEPLKGGTLVILPPELRNFYESRNDVSFVWDAFRFVASLKNVSYVFSRMSTIEQVLENSQIFTELTPMSCEEKYNLLSFANQIRESMMFECTSCNYCLDVCSHQIAIPNIIALYNRAMLFGKNPSMKITFSNLIEGSRGQNFCVSCGKCEIICP